MAPHGFSTEAISALFVTEGGIRLGMGISSSCKKSVVSMSVGEMRGGRTYYG